MSSESSLINDNSLVLRRRGAVDAGIMPTVLPMPPFLDCLSEKIIPDCPYEAVLTPQILQRPPSINLCWNCRDIPLGLFLCGNFSQDHIHYGDPDLDVEGLEEIAKSAASGCHLCNLLYDALMFADELRPEDPQWRQSIRERKFIDLNANKDGNLTVRYCATGREAQLKWHNTSTREGCQTGGRNLLFTLPITLTDRILAQIVHEAADSPENFVHAREWIRRCSETHSECKSMQDSWLPTRLLDIGTDRNTLDLRLIITEKELDLLDRRYLALSHCWGPKPKKYVARTTKANLKRRLKRIDSRELSKTFQDALAITKELGLRYIWIDSLCIIQDEAKDFESESAKMSQVYSRSYCTISASGSVDGRGGCFLPRNSLHVTSCTIIARSGAHEWRSPHRDADKSEKIISPHIPSWAKSLSGPLSARAWTLQERELSPRVIHYTKNRILWECKVSIASEDDPDRFYSKNMVATKSPLSPLRLLDGNLKAQKMLPNEAYHKWYSMVEDYSSRSLTNKSDKLPAISGIAVAFWELTNKDKYFAGLWGKDLLHGLSWFPDLKKELPRRPHRLQWRLVWPPGPIDPCIPSWSWAAHDGPVKHYGEDWFKGEWTETTRDGEDIWGKASAAIRILSVRIESSSVDPFGRVNGGEIVVRGWTIEVTVSDDHLQANLERHHRPKSFTLENDLVSQYQARLYFDVDPPVLPKAIEVLCLQLGTGKSIYPTFGVSADNGLVLMRSSSIEKESFRRVGMFQMRKGDLNWMKLRTMREVCIV